METPAQRKDWEAVGLCFSRLFFFGVVHVLFLGLSSRHFVRWARGSSFEGFMGLGQWGGGGGGGPVLGSHCVGLSQFATTIHSHLLAMPHPLCLNLQPSQRPNTRPK